MFIVTGATGHLGRLVVEELLARGVSASDVVAVVRDPQKAADLRARGVQARQADYDRPDTLKAAFAGGGRLLFVSSSEVGRRMPQHGNVVDAAVAAGVDKLVYTSLLGADSTSVGLAKEHWPTEKLIHKSGLPYTVLRNGWYLENYTEKLAPALEHGAIVGSAGQGRISAATRADYAAAAAVVLIGDGHDGATYELAGDVAFTMPELAAEVARHSGKPVVYRDLPEVEYAKALAAAGLPRPVAEMIADSDVGVAKGELLNQSTHLRDLIGRPTTPMPEAVAAALRD
ncbi:MAG: SDR family oxidoreductase [Stackebrandtia sp.]